MCMDRTDKNFFLLADGSIVNHQAGVSRSTPNAETVNGQRVVARETYRPWLGAQSAWLKKAMKEWDAEHAREVAQNPERYTGYYSRDCLCFAASYYGRGQAMQDAIKRLNPDQSKWAEHDYLPAFKLVMRGIKI